MKRSERLHRVFRLSETEEKAEGRRMGEAQRRLDAAVAQLDELIAWRKSYAERRDQPQQLTSSHWQDYQRFLDRLDEAIEVQSGIVADGRRQCDAQRRRWLVTRQRSDSLERVVAHCRDDERRERERNLQNLSDDLPRPPDPFQPPGSR